MDKNLSLKIILGVSVLGILFSGYLSFGELTQGTCPIDGGCSSMFGIPVCVFGLIMYLAIFAISFMGLKSKK